MPTEMQGNKEVTMKLTMKLAKELLSHNLTAEQDIDVALSLTQVALKNGLPGEVNVCMLSWDGDTGKLITSTGDIMDKRILSKLIVELQNKQDSL